MELNADEWFNSEPFTAICSALHVVRVKHVIALLSRAPPGGIIVSKQIFL